MQRWQDEFSKHPIHTTLNFLEENIKIEGPEFDSSGEKERARLLKVVLLIRKTVSDIDPDLAPIDVISALNNTLAGSTMNSVRAFALQGSSSHLQEANAHITAALGYVYQLSALRFGRNQKQADIEAATYSFEKFSRKIEASLAEMKAQGASALDAVVQASRKIEEIKSETDQLSTQFKEKISEWNNLNNEFLTTHKFGFAATTSQAKIDFTELLAAIRGEANLSLKSIVESEAALSEASRTKLMSLLEEIESDAEEKHKEILKFYSLVTHDSVTGGHKKIADREHDAAVFWRRFTVCCIGLTVVWIGCSLFWFTPQLEPDRLFWLQVGKSAALTALLISFSIYASRQSNLHRHNEQKARSFFLKVQAFDPFVASLPDEQRWSMKQAMTERIFAPDDAEDKSTNEAADFKGIDQIVSIFERVKAVFK